MADPVTTTAGASGTVTGIALVTFFAGLPADVVLGAFAGAILFVVSASEHGFRTRLILAIGSFFAGLTMYQPAASLLIDFLPSAYDGRGADAAGALLAAACVIRLLMMINSGSSSSGFFSKKKGGGDDNP